MAYIEIELRVAAALESIARSLESLIGEAGDEDYPVLEVRVTK